MSALEQVSRAAVLFSNKKKIQTNNNQSEVHQNFKIYKGHVFSVLSVLCANNRFTHTHTNLYSSGVCMWMDVLYVGTWPVCQVWMCADNVFAECVYSWEKVTLKYAWPCTVFAKTGGVSFLCGSLSFTVQQVSSPQCTSVDVTALDLHFFRLLFLTVRKHNCNCTNPILVWCTAIKMRQIRTSKTDEWSNGFMEKCKTILQLKSSASNL